MTTDPESLPPLSELTFQILLALGEGPRHGYAIIRDIEARTGGGATVRSGTLYATIQRMEDDGLVASVPAPDPEADARRRYYALTGLGRTAASVEAERLARMLRTGAERRLVPPQLRVTWDGGSGG